MKISDTEFYKCLREHDVWVMEEPCIGLGIIGRTSSFVYSPGEPGDTKEIFYFGFCPEADIDLDSGCASIYFTQDQIFSAVKTGIKTYRLRGDYDGCRNPYFSQTETATISLRFCNLTG